MKKIAISLLIISLFTSLTLSCKKSTNTIATEADSISYIIGLSVGSSLMKMDSTLNIDAVCEAIRDIYNSTEKMTLEQGRDYFLAQKTYFVHEKAEKYQEQFLTDLRKANRDFVRLRSGVTYKIDKLGDQSVQTLVSRDTLSLILSIYDQAGAAISEKDTVVIAYRDVLEGLREVIRITGNGGSADVWVPSSQAYGSEGNEELGITPNQLLNYKVDIIDINFYNKKK
ncbi:MAG: FKBP-type peptidyl-prolyl cis-trans isomerase [Alistipes sp.]|nr:FKBP-type peptidyl-prolyl cis-trans isomerase [Alistipes sp.]